MSNGHVLVADWAAGWKTGVRLSAGEEIFLFPIASRPALGPTRPPIQELPGALLMGVRRQGREAE
jgi:hypothetical protein